MSDRFTRFWARLLVVLGLIVVVIGLVLAVVALLVEMPWGRITGQAVLERAFVALSLVLSGILAGSPFIVFGELLLIALDQRRLLAAIHERLQRPEPPLSAAAPRVS
ncbi:MAG: hypothetical protein FJ027_16385 [Candidatus Rokubacteria bacterium]|nr:hypothetical protein [Candidatus Rokubacteria bacterium]